MSSVYRYRFIAGIKRGYPSVEFEPSDPEMHPDMIDAFEQNQRRRNPNYMLRSERLPLVGLVKKHLGAVFIPSNVNVPTLLDTDEVYHLDLSIHELSFPSGPIPIVSASASIILKFSAPLPPEEEMDEWQDENDFLDWGLSFSYDFNLSDDRFLVLDSYKWVRMDGPYPLLKSDYAPSQSKSEKD